MSGSGEAVSTSSTLKDLGDKAVSDLIGGDITSVWFNNTCYIDGTIKKVTGWTQFDANNPDGHFFPWQFAAEYKGSKITAKNRVDGDRRVTLDEDGILVIRIENFRNLAAVIETEKGTFTIDFSGAELA